jgi:hypothetical protein
MHHISDRVSTTGAASLSLFRRNDGRVVFQLAVPVGIGRRVRIDLGPGQARAVAEVLTAAIADIDALLGPRPTVERG